MSFGVSISDVYLVLRTAKDTVHDCRHAPGDFAEASQVSQSLYLLLEGVTSELQNQDSPLLRDDRTGTDFAIHFNNCETSLKPLAELIAKHKSLATSNKKFVDRLRFSKKDYLEYRGNLAFYTAQLSDFLQMVGLGSLGRIEHKVEDIKANLPELMVKIDQMFAEFRLTNDRSSVLSDHTDDEKFVWKAFRSKLNEAGFTSRVLREHGAAIFLRIRELSECGLLDTCGTTLADADEDMHSTSLPRGSDGPGIEGANNGHKAVSSRSSARIWRDIKGEPIEKGHFVRTFKKSNQRFVVILDRDGQEVSIPYSNLSESDLHYGERAPVCEVMEQETHAKIDPNIQPKPKMSGKDSECEQAIHESSDLPRRTRPDILVGRRTKPKIVWKYRPSHSELPAAAPSRSRSQLTCDQLPKAAGKGDLRLVEKLLLAGKHIESKGPKSWTETMTVTTGMNHKTTQSSGILFLRRQRYIGPLRQVGWMLSSFCVIGELIPVPGMGTMVRWVTRSCSRLSAMVTKAYRGCS